jgi:hypothetical protein
MKAARTDKNHSLIRDRINEYPGARAIDTFRLGDGKPDLIVEMVHAESKKPEMSWWEIKSEGGTLTDYEIKFHTKHRESRCINVCYHLQEILQWYGWRTEDDYYHWMNVGRWE